MRVFRLAHPGVLLVLLGISGGCRDSRPANHGPVLARLGAKAIVASDFLRYQEAALAPGQAQPTPPDPVQRRRLFEDFLDEQAVLEKARRVGMDQDQRFVQAVGLMETKLLARRMTERHRDFILAHSRVPDGAVEEEYNAVRHELLAEPSFTFRQVLVYVKGNAAFPDRGLPDARAKVRARNALGELRRGRSWEQVAKVYSDDLGTNQRGGLIRDGRFGLFPKEVEEAIRTQPLGVPGGPLRTLFGYHVIEVVDRVLDRQPRPLDQVRDGLSDRVRERAAKHARDALMAPIEREVGLQVTTVGSLQASLLDLAAIPSDALLASVGKTKVYESDFQWFLKDAFPASQRPTVFAQEGARQRLLRSFLDMLVLAAKARKDGLDRTPDALREREWARERLLIEFMQARDKAGPFCGCGDSEADRRASLQAYFAKTRAEVGLTIVADPDGQPR